MGFWHYIASSMVNVSQHTIFSTSFLLLRVPLYVVVHLKQKWYLLSSTHEVVTAHNYPHFTDEENLAQRG